MNTALKRTEYSDHDRCQVRHGCVIKSASRLPGPRPEPIRDLRVGNIYFQF